MKYWFFLVVCFFATLTDVDAQAEILIDGQSKQPLSLDFGMWGYASGDGFGYASWNMMYVEDNLFEVRHNFDNTEALSLYYGKRLYLGEASITPAVGFVRSPGYSAVGVSTHFAYENQKLKLYSINQFNKGTVPDGNDIVYHWIDFSYKINSWLNVGCSDQYYSMGGFNNFDAGPSIGFFFRDFYAKVYGWDFWSEEGQYVGVWCGWYFEF